MSLSTSTSTALPHIPLTYDNAVSTDSALAIIFALRPEWEQWKRHIEFVRFTDGITNTLLKAVNKRPGVSAEEVDQEAVLLRAYGNGTDILIDRNRETQSHFVCATLGLAPPLYARFDNGLLYKFIPGKACSSKDLRQPEVWRGVARKLGQWHARLPVSSISAIPAQNSYKIALKDCPEPVNSLLSPEAPRPCMWTVVQRWITALPSVTPCTPERQATLQQELEFLVKRFGDTTGIANMPYVFSHCDLLSGNVIMEPGSGRRRNSGHDAIEPPALAESTPSSRSGTPASSFFDQQDDAAPISFIDYEYATPAPAAFDLANHFAEWAGFECEYTAVPTQSQRREFLAQYLPAFYQHRSPDADGNASHSPQQGSRASEKDLETELDHLMGEIEQFRGVPGFYWGVWALIQSGISKIDFDYASYAEHRFGEYWDWKHKKDSVREKRWAEE